MEQASRLDAPPVVDLVTPAMALKSALEAGPNLGLVVVVGSYEDLDGVEIINRATIPHADVEALVRVAALRARGEARTVVVFAENVRRSVPSVLHLAAHLILAITKCRAGSARTVPLPARR